MAEYISSITRGLYGDTVPLKTSFFAVSVICG